MYFDTDRSYFGFDFTEFTLETSNLVGMNSQKYRLLDLNLEDIRLLDSLDSQQNQNS